jgi:hypothetical protein
MINRTENPNIYQPKGGMCANCIYKNNDCSKLPFGQMVVIDSYSCDYATVMINIVKCTNYKRK